MKIRPSDAESGLLALFWDYRIPVESGLSYTTLCKEWPRKRMRHADMSQAIERLCHKQSLRRTRNSEGDFFLLTESGQARARSIYGRVLPSLVTRLRFLLIRFFHSNRSAVEWPRARREMDRKTPPGLR